MFGGYLKLFSCDDDNDDKTGGGGREESDKLKSKLELDTMNWQTRKKQTCL
jgi:hypothetical protein